MILARHPEFWLQKNQDKKVEVSDIENAFEELILKLKTTRREEGHRIVIYLLTCLNAIGHEWQQVKDELPKLQKELEAQYRTKMDELFNRFQVEDAMEQRLASEIALHMEKRDCGEEMERIKIHLESLYECLNEGQNHLGKRIDFMAQELLREWTTLGSKVRHHKIFHHVLNAKLEIEKIREQSLNLI
jgi:uncharacterized protein (TIGR00255 family)